MKNIIFLIICYWFLLLGQCQADSWKCEYGEEEIPYKRLLTSNVIKGYACGLHPIVKSSLRVTEIQGRHLKSDYDVKLLASNSKLEAFSSIFCQKFNNLEAIWIERADIGSFDKNSLKSCKTLKFINLDGNKLRELPETLLAENSELSQIVIQNNEITSLSETFFKNQKKLQLLVLVRNKINYLPPKIFHSLTNLEELNLYSNKLQFLNPELFVNLDNLRMLSLENNQINFLTPTIFHQLVNLEYLNLDGNELQSLDSEWFANLRNLKNLTLIENQITEVKGENFFPSQNQLQFLDLEQNQIRNLPPKFFHQLVELERLYLGNNLLKVIDPEWFIHSKNLKYLGLNENQISQVPDEYFFSIQNHLAHLDLGQNQISFMPSKFFQPLVKLEYLSLYNNKLQVIDPKWFTNLKSLETLVLAKNEIKEVPTKSFKSPEKLFKLYLNRNQIKTLSPDCFIGLQKLNMLTLSMNKISELPSEIFVPLKSLKELHITDNNITIIDSDFFGTNKNLEIIDVMNNKITAFDEKVIDNTAIRYLNMTNNLCFNEKIEYRYDIKLKMRKCFNNYRSRCGTSKAANRNIISGIHITPGVFPWIAAVENKNGEFLCTGTLVTNKKVVTAASCILDKNSQVPISASDIKVFLGTNDLNNKTENEKSAFEVESVHLHSEQNKADIAVLVLKQEITSSYYIEPVCLFSSTSTIDSIDNGVVVGFNKNKKDEHENFATVFNISIDRTSDCLQTNPYTQNISSYQTFCGRISNGTCNIESGSGMYVHRNGEYYLRGITTELIENRSNQCDENGNLIFTNMPMFSEWINGINNFSDTLDKNSANLNSQVAFAIYIYCTFVILILNY